MTIDETFLNRARAVIAQGALTNSKRPETDVMGVFPTHFDYGDGAHMYLDGVKYLDYVCGLGSIHFGYNNYASTISGGCLSGSTKVEVLAAEAVKDAFRCIEKVKFVNDGTEACSAALRIARAYTGRKTVISEGYHGWSDEFTYLNDNAQGIGCDFAIKKVFDISEISSLDIDFSTVAAIIIEPVMLDDSDARINQLRDLRKLCSDNGIVLIFDEVVTGIRYPSFSVANHHAVQPDLICLGKALANGHKIGVVGGRSDLMDGDYFVSGTYFGHITTLAVVFDILMIISKTWPTSLDLNERGRAYILKFNDLKPSLVKMRGWGCRANFEGDWETIALFRQYMIEQNIFTKTTWFLNHANELYLDDFISHSSRALAAIDSGEYRLKGKLPEKPVSMKVRGQ
jgi:glutamate-1-semialdehyde aminotransferase